jgi:hypothetical protein
MILNEQLHKENIKDKAISKWKGWFKILLLWKDIYSDDFSIGSEAMLQKDLWRRWFLRTKILRVFNCNRQFSL